MIIFNTRMIKGAEYLLRRVGEQVHQVHLAMRGRGGGQEKEEGDDDEEKEKAGSGEDWGDEAERIGGEAGKGRGKRKEKKRSLSSRALRMRHSSCVCYRGNYKGQAMCHCV